MFEELDLWIGEIMGVMNPNTTATNVNGGCVGGGTGNTENQKCGTYTAAGGSCNTYACNYTDICQTGYSACDTICDCGGSKVGF